MKRSALRTLLRNLLAASLPLAACTTPAPAPVVDMAMAGARPDMAQPLGPDMMSCPIGKMSNGGCDDTLYIDGGVPANPTVADCVAACGDKTVIGCSTSEDSCGTLLDCQRCSIGRRPETLAAVDEPAGDDAVGRFFAYAAHLEAASVEAFEILARELTALGAPRSLVERARRAAGDERRHARVTAALARRFGAEPADVCTAPAPLRDLERLALDNAVEGCVRETFGALVAAWQGRAAGDAAIRAAMARIAEDETRHAELAWDIAAWAEPRLTAEAAGRVTGAREAAAAALVADCARPIAGRLVAVAGLPGGTEARFLAEQFAAAVTAPGWRAAA